jgi:hypothetical protein
MFSISNRAWCFALSGACVLAGCSSFKPNRADVAMPARTDASATPVETPSVRTNTPPAPEIHASATTNSFVTLPEHILAWDARVKTYHAKVGDESASFTFNVTNVSPAEVVIEDTSTSCGCTVAELPADPWKLAPGAHGQIQVTMDFNGQIGDVSKEVMVITSKGSEVLTVESVIPEPVFPAAAK